MRPTLRPLLGAPGFYAHKTPGDGSCLIHAVVYLLSPTYRQKTALQKLDYAKKLRNEMADQLDQYWEDLEMSAAAKAFPQEYSYEAISQLLRSKQWLNDLIVGYLEELFDIQIIIYDEKNRSMYPHFETNDRSASIVINYCHSHFESVVYRKERGVYLLSHDPNSEILSLFQHIKKSKMEKEGVL